MAWTSTTCSRCFACAAAPTRTQTYRLGGPTRSLVDELEPVVRALNARRQLLLLDDLHLVDIAAAARILGHLARHVRDSRMFAASRLEIPLLTDAATPVVTRLAPLGDNAARTMLAHLVERLGVEVRDESGILRRAGGSPFFLQRELASAFAKPLAPTDDRLGATLTTCATAPGASSRTPHARRSTTWPGATISASRPRFAV